MTALDLITGALREINAVPIRQAPSRADADFGLEKLNDLVDEWAARRVYIYNESVLPIYTLAPGLNPHTIGPMGQLTQSSRANNVATFICANNFENGQSVTIWNSTNGLNVTGLVQAATAAQFGIASIGAAIPLAADTGNAVLTASPVPTFGTPNMGQRPQRIAQATLVLTDVNPVVDVEMNIRDSEWWMSESVKGLQTDIPTDLYYDPDWPNGSIYLWPVPNYSYGIRLRIWGTIPQFPSVNYTFSLPPGYQKALKLTLARDMVGAFQGSWTPQQESQWSRAMKAVTSNNVKSPRGVTGDVGMPGTQRWGDYNYFSGLPSSS